MHPCIINVIAMSIGDFSMRDMRALLSDPSGGDELREAPEIRANRNVSTNTCFQKGACKTIQIAIGAHEPTLLMKNYVVFDVEQVHVHVHVHVCTYIDE
jgi:hypothetical protein